MEMISLLSFTGIDKQAAMAVIKQEHQELEKKLSELF